MWVALCISLLALLGVVAEVNRNFPIEFDLSENTTLDANKNITINITNSDPHTPWDLFLHRSGTHPRSTNHSDDTLLNWTIQPKDSDSYYSITTCIPIDSNQTLGRNLWRLVAKENSSTDQTRLGRSAHFKLDATSPTMASNLSSASTPSQSDTNAAVSSSNAHDPSTSSATANQGEQDSGSGPSNSTNPTKSNKPLIIGLTVGLSAFVLGCILVFFFIRRRCRRLADEVPQDVVFNRELMFERRPSPFDTWSLRSVELEKGSLRPGAISPSRVHITRTTTSDRDVS